MMGGVPGSLDDDDLADEVLQLFAQHDGASGLRRR